MKKTLLVLAMALLIALPIFSLAAEEAALPETETIPVPATQYGRRWRQTAPQSRFEDADNDGICDNCGQAQNQNQNQGQNPDAPGFADENKDGVCDNFGTGQQGQGRRGNAAGCGQRVGRMGRRMGRGMRGNVQGQGQGQGQGRGFVDADGNGICDHAGSGRMQNQRPGQGNFGPCQGQCGGRPGRNRR